MENGLHYGVSFSDYCAHGGLNASTLKALVNGTPADCLWAAGRPQNDTSSMAVGRLTHSMIFEADKVKEEFALFDDGTRRGAKWEAFKKRHANRTILNAKEWGDAETMAVAVLKSKAAQSVLGGGAGEVSAFWDRNGIQCKARTDYYVPGKVILDLKTSAYPVSPQAFPSTCVKYGYHLQAAFYVDGIFRLTKERLPFIFIAVESFPPHKVSVMRASDRFLAKGEEEVNRTVDIYRRCRETNNWPGYEDKVVELELDPREFRL